MAVTGDGLVIAALRRDSAGTSEVRLIHCADLRCQKPRAVTVDSLGWWTSGLHSSPLAVAVRRDGRPVVAVASQL